MQYKERLIGFCWAEFSDNQDSYHAGRLSYCIENMRFQGAKIHPRYQGVSVRDKRVEELAFRHPETKIIICHMGGHYALDAYAAARNNDNVYLDLSNSIIRYQGSSVISDI